MRWRCAAPYPEAEVALLHAVTRPGVLNRLLEEIARLHERVERVAARLYDGIKVRMWMAAEQELAALGYLIAPEPSLGSTVRRMLGRSTRLQPNGVTHGTTARQPIGRRG